MCLVEDAARKLKPTQTGTAEVSSLETRRKQLHNAAEVIQDQQRDNI
jgi:hypothetical protein